MYNDLFFHLFNNIGWTGRSRRRHTRSFYNAMLHHEYRADIDGNQRIECSVFLMLKLNWPGRLLLCTACRKTISGIPLFICEAS